MRKNLKHLNLAALIKYCSVITGIAAVIGGKDFPTPIFGLVIAATLITCGIQFWMFHSKGVPRILHRVLRMKEVTEEDEDARPLRRRRRRSGTWSSSDR